MANVVLPRHTTLHGLRDQSHLNTHQIGELTDTTRSLVRRLSGLATGIRPSLLAALGLRRYGAPDHLSSSGRAAWHVSLTTLRNDAELAKFDAAATCDDLAVLTTLTDWLSAELECESVRWHYGVSLLRHMQLVFAECPTLRDPQVRQPLVDEWQRSLEELRYAIHAGKAVLGPHGGRVITRLRASLAELKQTDRLHEELAQLSHIVDSTQPDAVPMPLLSERGRIDLLDLLKQV